MPAVFTQHKSISVKTVWQILLLYIYIYAFIYLHACTDTYMYIDIHTQKNTKQATGENTSIEIFWRNTQKSVTSPNNPFLYKFFGLTKKEHFSSRGLCTTLKIY